MFLWFRPQGIPPERRRRTDAGRPRSVMPNEDVVTLAGAAWEPGLPVATRSVSVSAPPDDDPLLRTVDPTRDFGGVHAVAGVSIEVRRGTLAGLIGPNGAGDSLRGRRYWRGDEEAAIGRARAMLDRFGLSGYADTYAGDLSGGQRRLTEIMRALMAEPPMLLPTWLPS